MYAFLDGLKVLEFAHMMAGPLAARRLADFGADVIKIEPKDGDRARFAHGPPGNVVDGDHLRFHLLNGGKRSVALDLKDEADRGTALRLARDADVVIQNYRAGALERYGLGYEQLKAANPALVYASVNGFGPGVWRDDPGQDLLAQARSGLMWLSGSQEGGPVAVGNVVVDITAGNLLTQGILAAVVGSRATGRGSHVQTSLLEAALELQVDCLPMYLNRGDSPPIRSGIGIGANPEMDAPYGVYATADGHLAITSLPAGFMAELLGPGAAGDAALTREERREIQLRRLAPVMKQQTNAYWLERLAGSGALVVEVLDWDQLAASEGFEDLAIMAQEPNRRGVRTMRPTIRFDGERPAPRVAPKLDADGEDIRSRGWSG